MKNYRDDKTLTHSVDGVFTFALMSIFTVFTLFIVVIGTKVYKDIIETSQVNNEVRSSLSYVANKIRSNDKENVVKIETKAGIDVLRMEHEYDGESYETVIYFYEGAVYEYFGSSAMEFSPSYGEKIIEVSDFHMSMKADLLYFEIMDRNGNTHEIHVVIRS